jgi:hypothetical protein
MSKEQEAATEEPFWRRPVAIAPRREPEPEPEHVHRDAMTKVVPEPNYPVLEVRDEPVSETSPASVPIETVQPVNPYEAAKAAEHALILARQEARECRDGTLRSRTAFAKALADWNGSGPVMTQEQQAREFIRTSNEDRARKAAAGQGIVHAGITRTARAMAGGNQRRGGGSAYRRGPDGTTAFTKSEAMTLEANRLRAAAAARVKLPSEK